MSFLDIQSVPIQVAGEGPPDARIMIVGEAPSKSELVNKRPFVGPTGRILNQLLAQAKIVRNACYITNVVKQFIPKPVDGGDKYINYVKFKSDGFHETTALFDAYVQILKEEIERINPVLIVALGKIALFALTGQHKIDKYRGSMLPCNMAMRDNSSDYDQPMYPSKDSYIEPYKVVATLHPTSIFHNPINQHIIQLDLQKCARQQSSPLIKYREREFLIEPKKDQIFQFLEEQAACNDPLAFDTEVIISSGRLHCLSFATSPDWAICIPFKKGDLLYFTLEEEIRVMKLVAQILENPDKPIIIQNAMFDVIFMWMEYNIMTRCIEDTMIMMGIFLSDFRMGLDFQCSIFTDEPYYKDEKYYKDETGDIKNFWIYNAKDSACTFECRDVLVKNLKDYDNWQSYIDRMKVFYPMMFMSVRGIRVDLAGLESIKPQAQEKIAMLEDKINEITINEGFGEINPRSPVQLKDYFYNFKGYAEIKDRSSGKVTTNETARKRLIAKGDKVAALISSLAKVQKISSTYYNVKLDEDKRLRGSYNLVGTKNGRFSSGQSIFKTGANMQNQPYIMKKYFPAEDYHIIGNVDLSSAENRVVAYIAPDVNMIRLFEEGIDSHSYTAAAIFPEHDYEEIVRMNGDKVYCDLGKGDKTHRFYGKKANHSLNYREGVNLFAQQNEITVRESRRIIRAWENLYPGMKIYWQWVEEKLRTSRTLIDCFGKKKLFFGKLEDRLFKQAYAYIPQSTVVGKINLHGLYYIHTHEDIFKNFYLRNQVHDSISFEFDTRNSFNEFCTGIDKLIESLETPVTFGSSTFIIPADMSYGISAGDLIEMNWREEVDMDALRTYYMDVRAGKKLYEKRTAI